MTKITAEHLARSAYVYIRQSTADQLLHNRVVLPRPAPHQRLGTGECTTVP